MKKSLATCITFRNHHVTVLRSEAVLCSHVWLKGPSCGSTRNGALRGQSSVLAIEDVQMGFDSHTLFPRTSSAGHMAKRVIDMISEDCAQLYMTLSRLRKPLVQGSGFMDLARRMDRK